MKVTFLGHASWLFQTPTATVACDLLVENEFRNGTFTICPTRELDVSAMPKLDALIITHSHRDHFDLETLVRLDRRTKIFCPNDPLILHALYRLGYSDVERFGDWTCHEVNGLELIFTPSDNRVPENGFLATDGDVVVWNHVDTVINATTIGAIEERLGTLDLCIHGYQPMLETATLESLGEQFPVETYRRLLHTAKLIAPRALVPGSNGYRTAGANAWFNAFKFPVTRERFVADINDLLPGTQTFIPNPGDVLIVEETGIQAKRQAAENGFVRTPVDDAATLMAFDPSRPKPELTDDNPLQVGLRDLHEMVRVLGEKRLPEGSKHKVPRMHLLRLMQAVVEVRVVYPDGTIEPWLISFSKGSLDVSLGASGDRSDFVITVQASALHGFALGQTRLDIIALAGRFRMFSRGYRVNQTGLVPLRTIAPAEIHPTEKFPSLLFHLLGFESDWSSRQIDAELDRLLGEGTPGVPLWERAAPRPVPAGWATLVMPRRSIGESQTPGR